MYTIIWLYLMKNSCCKCGLLYKLFCTCKEKHYDAAWSSNKINTNIFFSHFLYLLGFFTVYFIGILGKGVGYLNWDLTQLEFLDWHLQRCGSIYQAEPIIHRDGEIGWGATFWKKFKIKNIYYQYLFGTTCTCITCLFVGQVPLTLLSRFPVLYSCN